MNRIQVMDDSDAKMLGWTSTLLKVGHSLAFTIKAEIIRGLKLYKGCKIFSYIAEDQLGRVVIISAIDKPK